MGLCWCKHGSLQPHHMGTECAECLYARTSIGGALLYLPGCRLQRVPSPVVHWSTLLTPTRHRWGTRWQDLGAAQGGNGFTKICNRFANTAPSLQVADTLAEIQERHEAVKELEKSLLDLHQIFLVRTQFLECVPKMRPQSLDSMAISCSASVLPCCPAQQSLGAVHRSSLLDSNIPSSGACVWCIAAHHWAPAMAFVPVPHGLQLILLCYSLQDMAVLVEAQGEMLDNIEAQVMMGSYTCR